MCQRLWEFFLIGVRNVYFDFEFLIVKRRWKGFLNYNVREERILIVMSQKKGGGVLLYFLIQVHELFVEFKAAMVLPEITQNIRKLPLQ